MNNNIEFEKVDYNSLNSRQKETYNFQKISSVLADYGYATIKLNDDWQSADFIAQHIDGETYLKVQLKSRLTFNSKYAGKNIFISFPNNGNWYFYDHDKLLNIFLNTKKGMKESKSWSVHKSYTFARLGKEDLRLLHDFQI